MNKRAKRGAARWCERHDIEPGARLECYWPAEGWASVRLTAIGETAVLLRRPSAAEFSMCDPGRLRMVPA